jgi:hypothetical protein
MGISRCMDYPHHDPIPSHRGNSLQALERLPHHPATMMRNQVMMTVIHTHGPVGTGGGCRDGRGPCACPGRDPMLVADLPPRESFSVPGTFRGDPTPGTHKGPSTPNLAPCHYMSPGPPTLPSRSPCHRLVGGASLKMCGTGWCGWAVGPLWVPGPTTRRLMHRPKKCQGESSHPCIRPLSLQDLVYG